MKKFINENKNVILVTLIAICMISITMYFSYSYYTDSDTINLTNSSVGHFNNSNLNIKYMVEQRDSDGTPNGEYISFHEAPSSGYTFDEGSSSCTNGATFEVDTNNYISVTTDLKTSCEFYFKANSELGDNTILINVFKQQSKKSTNYIQAQDYKNSALELVGFYINSTMSSCSNGASVTYNTTTNLIEVSTSNKTICNVYFDIE